MVVTLPVMMNLLDYWPLNRFESRKGNLLLWQLKEKLPFFVLSAILVIITLYNPNNSEMKPFPLVPRLANAPVAFVAYLLKTFRPYDMAVFYPFSTHIPLWQVIGASLLILLITALVIIMAKRLPCLFVGWLWFAIAIAPVIGIIQISIHAYSMADRYHYLPSIGIAMMLAWGIPSLIKDENIRKKILFPVALAFLIIMAVLSWIQCGYWKNSGTLFNHALKVTENNALAHGNYASALYVEGRIDEAFDHFNKAINMPNYEDAEIYSNRGAIYSLKNQYQLAMNDYNKAISLNTDCYRAYNNRGILYANSGRYRQAIEDFNKAALLNPAFADAYSNRAFIYYKQSNKFSCCSNARKACELGNCEIWKAVMSEGLCR
jgi:tetratricopeptide (TPR) repeat protein